MITILTWVSIIAGGILVILLLISLIGGLDIDVDVETGGGDTDTSAGGIGLLKGALTFISVSSWVMKVLMVGQQGKTLSIVVGVLSGILAFILLNYLLKALLRNEENVNWEMSDSLFQRGITYLKIPEGGEGLVQIKIRGAIRELKAKSKNGKEIKTGDPVMVLETLNEYAIVERIEE
jgi:membrane-bound ClpP family serine protease